LGTGTGGGSFADKGRNKMNTLQLVNTVDQIYGTDTKEDRPVLNMNHSFTSLNV